MVGLHSRQTAILLSAMAVALLLGGSAQAQYGGRDDQPLPACSVALQRCVAIDEYCDTQTVWTCCGCDTPHSVGGGGLSDEDCDWRPGADGQLECLPGHHSGHGCPNDDTASGGVCLATVILLLSSPIIQ